jgi:hypothetical protein
MSQTATSPVSVSLSPYTGPWTAAEAAHILRRTMFGPTFQQIQSAVNDGLSTTLNNLLTIPPLNSPLVVETDEAIAGFGTTWVGHVFPTNDSQTTENARHRSLASWLMERINSESFSIAEKMCLFWQNHFAAKEASDSCITYNYHALIRTHALGNFKQLVKDMTIDPCMLLFLDGRTNTKNSPNENYSRELLELYSIGKGPQVATGDYTTYTETDVSEGAKILTGWKIDAWRSDTIASPSGLFDPYRHDTSTKTLSSRFNNVSIPDAGSQEYENYIDIIFQQPALAEFICKKIYRYFVNYDMTQDVMTNIIPGLAQTFMSNNYDILPVMRQLLSSEHFFDMSVRGSMIRSPLETIFAMYNSTHSKPSHDLATNYKIWLNIHWVASVMGQDYLSPPNVGGWAAYYQAPAFSQLWVNTSNLKLRFDFSSWQTIWGGFNVNMNRFKVNALEFVNNLSDPYSPPAVIDDMCTVFFPKAVPQSVKDELRLILTNGLQDFEWTAQYADYLANPGDLTYENPVRDRVEFTLARLFKMPYFHTL